MSVEAVEAPLVTDRPTLRDLAVRGVAWALLMSCLVLLASFVLVGERPGSYADLRAAVADGRVDEVRIEGGLENGAIGSAGASVHWRDGLIRRAATVTEASSRQQARALEGDGPVVIGSVGATLVALHPELQTSRSDQQTRSDFGAWRVPRWVNVLA